MIRILTLLLLPAIAIAQKDYPALLDQYMKAAVAVNEFSGSVLIAKNAKPVYQKTFGTLDYANTRPLDNHSLFELGMLTEQFTAAAILLLRDEGKLTLSDPITHYFPELPYNSVLIQHLLTHSSGLPDYYETMKEKWGTERYATNEDLIQSLSKYKVPLA